MTRLASTGCPKRLNCVTETQRADQAAQALIDFKDGIEQEKARVALRTERVAAVADATDLLEMTDERADRITAMDEAAFASYVSDLREIAAKAPKEDPKKDPDAAADAKGGDDKDEDDPKTKTAEAAKAKGKIPRESAAFGGTTTTAKSTGTVIGVIGAWLICPFPVRPDLRSPICNARSAGASSPQSPRHTVRSPRARARSAGPLRPPHSWLLRWLLPTRP